MQVVPTPEDSPLLLEDISSEHTEAKKKQISEGVTYFQKKVQ